VFTTRRCAYDCSSKRQTTDAFGNSYNPAISGSYTPSNVTANISTMSGGSTTGRFAYESYTIQSATAALNFTYNASGMYTCLIPILAIDMHFFHAVVFADPFVTRDLFPPGARAVLGFGVNAPADSPPGASLLPYFLP